MRVTEYSTPARAVAFVLSLAVLNLVQPVQALAQVNVGASSGFSGGTVTTPILFPDGAIGAPAIAFASEATMGFYRTGSNSTRFVMAGVDQFGISPSTLTFRSGTVLAWTNGNVSGTSDTFMIREAAANFQLGSDVNGAAVDQTLSAADAITGADISGGDLTIQSGSGMGTGTVSALIFQTPTIAAAGANAQSLATRASISSAGLDLSTNSTPFILAGATGITWSGAGFVRSSGSGLVHFLDAAGTSFTRLQLGGTVDDHPAIAKSATVSGKSQGVIILHADGVAPVFADLGAATNGSMIYCSDCTIANPCAGAGTGAIAKRLNGVWVCN